MARFEETVRASAAQKAFGADAEQPIAFLKGSGVRLFLYEDRICTSRSSWPLDALTIAEAVAAGDVRTQQTSRFTVTRMAIAGPLALAAPKRTTSTVDTRMTKLYVDGDGWAEQWRFSALAERQVRDFAAKVNKAVRDRFPDDEPPPADPPDPLSVADELGKLAALRDAGVITADEFDAQKAKLLGL